MFEKEWVCVRKRGMCEKEGYVFEKEGVCVRKRGYVWERGVCV